MNNIYLLPNYARHEHCLTGGSFIVYIVLRNCHVYASQLPCLRFMNAMFMLHECHVYNIQMMMF